MTAVLDIAKNAAVIAGMTEPSTLNATTNPDERILGVLLNRVGKRLARMRNSRGGGWSVLTREHTFLTEDGVEEYAFPADFHSLVDGSVWDRDSYYEARGPLSPQQWQTIKSGLIESVALTPRYRIRRSTAGTGRAFWVDPVPSQAETLVYEYISDAWLMDSGGTEFRSAITDDADEPVLDSEMVESNLIWRVKQAQHLNFAVELADAEMETKRLIAEDTGLATVNLSDGRRYRYAVNIPESGFG